VVSGSIFSDHDGWRPASDAERATMPPVSRRGKGMRMTEII
jgi:hypothetical protein